MPEQAREPSAAVSPPEEPLLMEVHYAATEEHYVRFVEHYFKRLPEGRRSNRRLFSFAFMLLLIFALFEADHPRYGLDDPPQYALYMLVSAVMLFGSYWLFLRYMRPLMARMSVQRGPRRKTLGDTVMRLTSSHLYLENSMGAGRIEWRHVPAFSEDDDFFYILLGRLNAFTVPKEAFSNEHKQNRFRTLLEEHAGSATTSGKET